MKKNTIAVIAAAVLVSVSSSLSFAAADISLPAPRPEYLAKKAKSVEPAAAVCKAEKINGYDRTWKVYVPSSLNKNEPAPLVVALHGFGGPSMDYGSAWHLTAERAGFIVLYPEAIKPHWWNIWELSKAPEDPDDVAYLDAVIERTRSEYRIDPSRIYLTGVSMGDNMATTYAFKRAAMFAAIAPTDGPTLPSILTDEKTGDLRFKPQTAVPSLRLHAELDCMAGLPSCYQQFKITNPEYQSVIPLREKQALRHMMDQIMKDLWLERNGCGAVPKFFSIGMKRNIAVYPGKDNCDYYAYSTINEGHGGGYERSDFLWDEFFSAFRKENGKVVRVNPVAPVVPDRNAVAIAAGASRAFVDNRPVSIPKGKVVEKKGELFIPVSFLPEAFPGTEVALSGNGKDVVVKTPSGSILKAGAERPLMILDNRVVDTPEVFIEDGEIMLSARVMAADVFKKYYSAEFQAAYISDKPAHLTYDFAADFRVMLGVDKAPVADIAMEKATVQKILDSRAKKQ